MCWAGVWWAYLLAILGGLVGFVPGGVEVDEARKGEFRSAVVVSESVVGDVIAFEEERFGFVVSPQLHKAIAPESFCFGGQPECCQIFLLREPAFDGKCVSE